MATGRLFINENAIKKDGKAAVYALVHIDYKSIKINTGVCVEPARFDKVKGRVRGTAKADKDANLIIDKCLASINEIFVRYRLQERVLTADLLLREYKNPSMYVDFYAFMDKKILDRVKSKDIGATSGKHHRVLLNKLKEYKKTLSFAEIDLKMINSFKNYCRITKKNDVNTVHKMLSYWQTYMNIAKREEIISSNPFDNIQFNRIEPQRIYLTDKELKKMFELYEKEELPEHLHRTLRHFLFMCLTGVRISDFIRLKTENIQENALRFVPHKTSAIKRKELHVPLIDRAIQLIKNEDSPTDFIFQSISEQKMNDQLKDIAAAAKINKDITNHSARHTFATNFIELTSDVATLQKILGHSNIRETMLYVHVSTGKIDQQMNNFGSLLDLEVEELP